MGTQVVVWSAVVILLFVLFVLREAIKMRRRMGNDKVFEFSDEFDLYDWDD